MERVNVVLAHQIDPFEEDLGDFGSWDEAEAEVARRCGGSLPQAEPVPTNSDEYAFTHVRRIAKYVSRQDFYRFDPLHELTSIMRVASSSPMKFHAPTSNDEMLRGAVKASTHLPKLS